MILKGVRLLFSTIRSRSFFTRLYFLSLKRFTVPVFSVVFLLALRGSSDFRRWVSWLRAFNGSRTDLGRAVAWMWVVVAVRSQFILDFDDGDDENFDDGDDEIKEERNLAVDKGSEVQWRKERNLAMEEFG
ncbi:hypothetical protein ACFX13_015928 [Malus domestica]